MTGDSKGKSRLFVSFAFVVSQVPTAGTWGTRILSGAGQNATANAKTEAGPSLRLKNGYVQDDTQIS
jgi:hypothetical protein